MLDGMRSMVIAWTDLNNVQEAGDYSFRDGRITISFAEIAVWKNNPRATLVASPGNGVDRAVESKAGRDTRQVEILHRDGRSAPDP
jgi:hypothetical protein